METKKNQSTECEICWSVCNKSNRKVVECPYCHLKACRVCVKYYLTSKTNLAHCMGCNKPWDRKFMQETLTKSYFNGTWKDHRKGILFETEKARFPETMPKVEKTIQIRKCEKELRELRIKQEEALLIWQKAKRNADNIAYKIDNLKNYSGKSGEEKRQFIKKCPVDDCTGFLSTGYKCGLCEVRVCSKCHEPMGYTPDCKEQHECNPDTVAAIQLIKQETKPCPQCVAPIYKISGCDQMWCTACNIAFSWRTGLKVTGTIHNPHYYEFMRQNGGNQVQNPGAVNCGGLPYHVQMTSLVRQIKGILSVYFDMSEIKFWLNDFQLYLPQIHRGVGHFQGTILDPIRRAIQQNRDNEDLRIRYIMKEIQEEQFKTNLIKRDNAFEKKQAMLHIYELMGNVFVETAISMYNEGCKFIKQANNLRFSKQSTENPDTVKDQLNKLAESFIEEFKTRKKNLDNVRCYCNKELVKVSLIYSQVVQIIDDIFNTSKIKKEECKAILKSNNYSFILQYDHEGRILYKDGKNWRTRRPKYVGLDE